MELNYETVECVFGPVAKCLKNQETGESRFCLDSI